MGREPQYWTALQQRVESLNYTHLIEEIAQLSAKVHRYEQLIDDMSAVRSAINRRFE